LPTDEKDPDADAYERAGPGTLTDIEQAQAELLAKVATLKLNTKDVARLYRADMGLTIQEETDPQRMRDFTKRLDVNVFKKDAK
jgi:methylphosphotriester-DNA--protein-cysteine methyltransferase